MNEVKSSCPMQTQWFNTFTDFSFLPKSLALGLNDKTVLRPNPTVSSLNSGFNPDKGNHDMFFYDTAHLWGWKSQTDWCAAQSTSEFDGGEVWEVPLLVRDGFENSFKWGTLALQQNGLRLHSSGIVCYSAWQCSSGELLFCLCELDELY